MTPYDAYKSDETYAESEMDALDVSNNYPNEYKNRIVLRWEEFSPSEVRLNTERAYKRPGCSILLPTILNGHVGVTDIKQ